MGLTIADKYYVKAMDEYPYDLEVVLENLQYALSYDEEHVGALYLMACFYMEQLHDYAQAEECFLQAIAVDPTNVQVCLAYTQLLLHLREYSNMKKMINYLHTLRGVDKAIVFALEAMYFETMRRYDEAINSLQQAKQESLSKYLFDELGNILERIEEKQKLNSPYFYEC